MKSWEFSNWQGVMYERVKGLSGRASAVCVIQEDGASVLKREIYSILQPLVKYP